MPAIVSNITLSGWVEEKTNKPSLMSRILRTIEIIGYARAGNALRIQGLNEEAQNCFNMVEELKKH